MIQSISISNYKCFAEEHNFRCGKINLYTGLNGRGKSSVLQILLLLSQSLRKSSDCSHLYLHGDYINLGMFEDVKNSYAPSSQKISIKLLFDNGQHIKLLCEEDENNPYRLLITNNTEVKNLLLQVQSATIEKLIREIHFVSADRLGPQLFVEKVELPNFIEVGKRGEYAFEVLSQSEKLNLQVLSEMYRGRDTSSLLQQTCEWMSYILDGARVEMRGKDSNNATLSMLVNNRADSYMYKPVNVGFGYSYILPLIISGLIAKPGQILIAENPEAHLHPRAQSRMAEFYCRLASAGVQVFIESHSEHVLNGIRLACVNSNIPLSNTDVSISFFDEDFSIKQLSILPTGKMDKWPIGFFDQKEQDIAELFRLSIHN